MTAISRSQEPANDLGSTPLRAEVVPPEPFNLMEAAYSGTLTRRVLRHQEKQVKIVAASILAFAGVVAGIVFLFTGETVHLAAAFPISIWLMTLAVPVIHKLAVRRLWVIKPMRNGAYELDETEWFKDDLAAVIDENHAGYEGGKRVHWLVRIERDGRVDYVPFNAWQAKELNNPAPNTEPVTAAHIAGLKSYLESVQEYSYKKTLGINDVVKLGVLGLIIGGLLLAIFLMSGRLTREPIQTTAPTVEQSGGATTG